VAAPGYAHGLALVGRLLRPLLEDSPSARYEVEGGRILAHRTLWLPRRQQDVPLVQPLWIGAQNFGPPLLAALILATPGWRWRRRGIALAVGLGLLTATQIAYLVVTIEATLQSPVMSPEGLVPPARYSPVWQPILYWLYYFFDIVGRGFFALLIYAAVIAVLWDTAAAPAAAVGRNSPCPCGSGLKYKRCCGR
jgi:MFS family permease